MRPAVGGGNCIRARRLFSVALDGEAAAADVLVAALHIARCETCHQFAAHVAALTKELRSGRLERPDHREDIERLEGGKS